MHGRPVKPSADTSQCERRTTKQVQQSQAFFVRADSTNPGVLADCNSAVINFLYKLRLFASGSVHINVKNVGFVSIGLFICTNKPTLYFIYLEQLVTMENCDDFQ